MSRTKRKPHRGSNINVIPKIFKEAGIPWSKSSKENINV